MSAAQLSVVVPSVNGWRDLAPCLAALASERDDVALEAVVVDRCGEELRMLVTRRFPWICVVPAAPATPIPELRAIGFDRAVTPSVAVIEDHVQVPRGWARALLAARATGADIVGGAVANGATERLADRAAFYFEYAHLMPPLGALANAPLAGNHVVYDRALLLAQRDVLVAGRWEDHLHARLRAAGATVRVDPALVVLHCRRAALGDHLAQRFHFARSWAAARAATWSRPRRALAGAAALAVLPPLLFARIVLRLARKEVAAAEIARCVPLLALLAAVSGVSEAVGGCFGAGRSTAAVR